MTTSTPAHRGTPATGGSPPAPTPAAVAAIPEPYRDMVRRRSPAGPLLLIACGVAGLVSSVLGFLTVDDPGPTPTWAAVMMPLGMVGGLLVGIVGLVCLCDAGRLFRRLYLELVAKADVMAPEGGPGDEVTLPWSNPSRAVVRRAGAVVGELHPERPVDEASLSRSVVRGPGLIDDQRGPRATGVLTDGTRRTHTPVAAEGPGPRHARRTGGSDGIWWVELDGRPTLETRPAFADAALAWWELPRPRPDGIRTGEPVVWARAPRHLSDDAVLFVLWRLVGGALHEEAVRARDRARSAAVSAGNAVH